MRACAYCIDALDGCVNSENEVTQVLPSYILNTWKDITSANFQLATSCDQQVPELIKKHMSNIALKVSSESSRVIKELARTMKTMKKSSTIDLLVGDMNSAILELQEDLKSLPNSFINLQHLQEAECPEKKNIGAVALMDIIPLVTLASLLIEIAARIEGMVDAVEELAELSEYKSVADEKKQHQPISKTSDEHKEEV